MWTFAGDGAVKLRACGSDVLGRVGDVVERLDQLQAVWGSHTAARSAQIVVGGSNPGAEENVRWYFES